jgi:hypothetical protein
MKWICLSFFFAVWTFFTSCSNSAISKKLSGSDSLVINFYAPNSDSIIKKTVQATDHDAIHKMTDFIDKKATNEVKCGYDGNLIFFSKGQPLLPVVFKYREAGCRHFSFELDGKLMSTSMNNEAADFLESLEKGDIYY